MAESAPQHLYIVEDDAAVRDALQLLLELRGYTVHAYGRGEDLLDVDLRRPACAIVDVRLPGIDGIALQQHLHRTQGGVPVIVVTAHGDVATARAALRNGAVDFLEKPIDDEELFAALRTAFADEAERLAREQERRAMIEALARLTPRELEVFERVTNGMHNREIAVELGISPRTVEVHRARILDKLQARRISDLFRVRFAIERDTPGAGAT